MNIRFFKSLFLALCLVSGSAWAAQPEKVKIGWAEKVKLYPGEIVLHAKIDTGADYSSLNATNIEEFDKDGEKWLRFSLTNRNGQKFKLERKSYRVALIKRHGEKHQRRPVVRLGVCLGGAFMETDVNIVDRTNFEFQMLIGRSFLSGNVVIDPSVSYTHEPTCPGVPLS